MNEETKQAWKSEAEGHESFPPRMLKNRILELIAENEELGACRKSLQTVCQNLNRECNDLANGAEALQQRVSELEALVRKAYKEGCGGPSDYAEKKWIQSIAREALKKAEAPMDNEPERPMNEEVANMKACAEKANQGEWIAGEVDEDEDEIYCHMSNISAEPDNSFYVARRGVDATRITANHIAASSPKNVLKLIAENEDLAAVKFAENALRQALQLRVDDLIAENEALEEGFKKAAFEAVDIQHKLQQRVSELEALVKKAYKEGCGGPSDYAEKKWIQSNARQALKKAEATDGE